MNKIAIITAALLVTSTSSFAEHFQVADAARVTSGPANGPSSDKNQSGNADRGYDALSRNPKADEAADKR